MSLQDVKDNWIYLDRNTGIWRGHIEAAQGVFQPIHWVAMHRMQCMLRLMPHEGQIADIFGPGLYTLNTRTLPLLTNLMNWDKAFQSPFKSDVYFFSTRLQTDQRWGTQNPITIRDKDFGMVRLRGHGIYSYHLVNPLIFHQKVSGTRDVYTVADIEGQLRNTIIGRVSDAFASSQIPFLDMAANLDELGKAIAEQVAPTFAELGLALDSFVVQNLSLPEELQRRLDERIGMNMVGNLRDYTQFQVAQSIPTAAANEGGGAGLGAGLGRPSRPADSGPRHDMPHDLP